jgi:hypothetical protein
MKKYILAIMTALAFMACKETFYVGGTVTDFYSKDSIEGIEMGLYKFKQTSSKYQDKKWSDLEFIATATTNSDGFFSMELESGFDMSGTIFLPTTPTDTLSVNAQYTPNFSQGLQYPQYGTAGNFQLMRSSNIQVRLINFTQDIITMDCGDCRLNLYRGHSYFELLNSLSPLTGKKYKFDFYTEAGDYLGSTSRYIKTHMPENKDLVGWLMPLQIIEVDFNTLEK